MNRLPNGHSAANLLAARYSTIIVTDILMKDGQNAQITTLISRIGMFEETVMGINKALNSGGKAAEWQSRVYSFRNGTFTNYTTYQPVVAANRRN